uniref:Vacuolar protein sorting-associated protein 52 homolog n=1 Tax=Salmo salar TaxID=8030 RepID=A7KIL3_SALSA|nr:vacuolar protein sorting 52 [Salmo salar]ACX35591.1 vacuolar protein sorting 52 [Salmo salar]
MADRAVTAAMSDVNTTVTSTANSMAYLQDEMKPDTDAMAPLNLGDLDLTTDEFILDEVDNTVVHPDRSSLTKLVSDIKESQNIASLHNQITACDSILERMEGMLSGFQSDLSSISSEIQTLQQQSVSMNMRLKNRQAVRSHLSQLVDELVVPGAMIQVILESPVTEQEFLEQLHELNNKINFAKELSFRETLACSDIQDIVDRLKIKAVTKIREFILQKIYSFRKPMTNYQIPQNTLLKYRFFYQFLLANERTVAKEIRDEYVDTMSKIYYSYFKSYSGRLLKVQYEEVADKDDLMGVEDTAKKGFFSKPSLKSRNTIFTLGQRGTVLSPAELEGPILIPHTAQRGDCRYPYETLFRSQHYALLDNGCREFLFLSDFFMVAGNSALDLFNSVMGKTLSLFLKSMSTYVSDCYDSIAVFLCIHIILRFRAITNKRTIPALDKLVLVDESGRKGMARIVQANRPQTYITAQHNSGVQNGITERTTRSLSQMGYCSRRPHWVPLISAKNEKQRLQWARNHQHWTIEEWKNIALSDESRFVLRHADGRVRIWRKQHESMDPSCLITRRYAEFSSAIVSINQTFTSERTHTLLGQLQVEVENFVLKMAAEFPSRRDQLIFLINNYDMMLSVLMERAADDSKEVEGFQQLLQARSQEFIEEILSSPFGGMIAFVKESEALTEKGQLDRLKNDEGESFTNFKNGTGIIQVLPSVLSLTDALTENTFQTSNMIGALTQLIQYYHGFHKVLSQPTFRSLAVRSELINLHHLMVEVKKHKPNF